MTQYKGRNMERQQPINECRYSSVYFAFLEILLCRLPPLCVYIYIYYTQQHAYYKDCLNKFMEFNAIHGTKSLQLSLYYSTALCWTLAAFSVSWSFYTISKTPWTGISPPQGRYLLTEQNKHRINAHRHICLEWVSNSRSQCLSGRRQFVLQTARPLWSASLQLTYYW
jgi:hypothetical protein